MDKHKIQFHDNSSNTINVFYTDLTSAPVVIIFPALGVKASYYTKFASELATHGIHVITTDNRGHGSSSVRPSRNCDYGYKEQIEMEYPAILNKARELFSQQDIYIMGHSLGGQMGSMFVSTCPDKVKGIIFNASCSVYYKGWKGIKGIGVLLFCWLSLIIAKILGYYPGNKLRFGGKEAKRLITDWSYTGRTGRFQIADSSFNYMQAMNNCKMPVLALTYKGDESAPYQALKNLYAHFHKDTEVTHFLLKHPDAANEKKYDHYSWVKEPGVSIPIILSWIKKQTKKEA